MWRARRWRFLLDVIERLPRDSAYLEAVADDEELAAAVIDHLGPPGKSVRRVGEWSVQVEVLSDIADLLTQLIHLTAAAHGAKPGRPARMPRPVTALDRLRRRQRMERHRTLVARLLPHTNHPT